MPQEQYFMYITFQVFIIQCTLDYMYIPSGTYIPGGFF